MSDKHLLCDDPLQVEERIDSWALADRPDEVMEYLRDKHSRALQEKLVPECWSCQARSDLKTVRDVPGYEEVRIRSVVSCKSMPYCTRQERELVGDALVLPSSPFEDVTRTRTTADRIRAEREKASRPKPPAPPPPPPKDQPTTAGFGDW